MLGSILRIETLCERDIDSLQSLVDEFVSTHQSLSFKDNYWRAFRTWLVKGIDDSSTLLLIATIHGDIAGFIAGDIWDNAPLISPDLVGHVSLLIVSRKFRKNGIGNNLWNELRSRFISRGVNYFELYTEYENKISGPFWSKRGFETFLEKRRLR